MGDILTSRVLVLNSNFVPINIISLKKALIKLVKNVAEIVTIENERYSSWNFTSWAEISELRRDFEELGKYDEIIGLGGFTFIIPRIIRVLTYDRFFKHPIKLNRKNIFARDKCICQYCHKKFSPQNLSIDHIIPRSQGGQSIWENLVCSCYKCNSKKRDRTPTQAGMKLLKQPHRPASPPIIKLTIGDRKYKDWQSFISEIYWETSIEES